MTIKKIAVVSPSQLEQVNETFIRAHVELLENTKFLYGGRIPFYSEGGEKVIRFSLVSKLIYKIKQKLGLTNFSYNQYECAAYLKRNKFTTILAEYGDVGAEMTVIARELNLELLVHFHGADISMHHILEEYGEKYKRMFAYAKNIFSVSNPMTEKMVEMGCDPDKIIKNTYGPGNHFFDVKPDYSKSTVVALGGFVNQKAPYFTIMAFMEVLKEVPNATLYYGGSGPLYNTAVNMAEYYGISKNVIFTGFIHPRDCAKHLSKGSVFIQHSLTAIAGDTEGTPVAIMEAMAAGLPIISTIHAGIPEVVKNDFNGNLVEEKDVDGMAKHLIDLLKNPEKKEKLGESARKLVKEKYLLEVHINRIRTAIEQ
jgi:glycosyltransferase involved in cell wall biosynthesis